MNNANAPIFRNGVLQAPTKRAGRGARIDPRFKGVNELGIPIPSNNPDDYFNSNAKYVLVNTRRPGVNLEKERHKRLRNAALKEYKIHRVTKSAWGSKSLLPEFNAVSSNASNSVNAPNSVKEAKETNTSNVTPRALAFRKRTARKSKKSNKTRKL